MVVDESTLSPTAFGRPSGDVVIVYDGECPFCRNFVAYQRLRENVGKVSLVNARDHLEDVTAARQNGLDLDEGMLVFWNGRIYEGGDAVSALARLSREDQISATRFFFSNDRVSRALYPALRKGRNIALKLLGRRKMRDVIVKNATAPSQLKRRDDPQN